MWTCADSRRSPARRRGIGTLLTAALVVLSAPAVHAQQELMISQYMFNGLFLNPAYAGSHPYTSATLLHRAQWVGIEGAPQTSLAGIDGPLLGNRMGLGLTISHDVIGVSQETEIAGNYAYRIHVADGRLAFGLKAGLSLYSATLSDLTYWDAQDVLYQGNLSNAAVGKFGFGLYWNNERTYIGLSVPTIYAADGQLTADLPELPKHYFTQHYYLNAGHVFALNADFDLKPSVLLKFQPQAPPEVDLNCNLLYRKRLWLGVGYRTGDAVVAMLEFQINPMFRVGYSYDATTTELRGYNSGSHEVMLGIDLGKEPIAIKNPRFF